MVAATVLCINSPVNPELIFENCCEVSYKVNNCPLTWPGLTGNDILIVILPTSVVSATVSVWLVNNAEPVTLDVILKSPLLGWDDIVIVDDIFCIVLT